MISVGGGNLCPYFRSLDINGIGFSQPTLHCTDVSKEGREMLDSFFYHLPWALRVLQLREEIPRIEGERCKRSTEPGIKAFTWLREMSSCSCLTVPSGPAWLLLSKICIPLFRALYRAALGGGPYVARIFCLLLPSCCLAKQDHLLVDLCITCAQHIPVE